MHLTFYGAAREVTGSMHLLTTGSDRILLDCGLFQGKRKESTAKNKMLPIAPSLLSNIVLSHAHIDHTGRLPLVCKNGFTGRIIATRATADACKFLLPDSAHIQESDASYLNYKMVRSLLYETMKPSRAKELANREKRRIKDLLKKNAHRLNTETIAEYIQKYHLEAVEPLYSSEDVEQTLALFDGYPYRHPITVGRNTTCTFYEAGHILGSAMCLMKVKEDGKTHNILFSGDIGRFNAPVLKDPCLHFADEDKDIDLLIMESTYGDREHEESGNTKEALSGAISETFERGGTLIIPAFAFGRTQTLLYIIHELYSENKVPRAPVYVDSPLAMNLTRVFVEHPEVYDQETHSTFLMDGSNPFQFNELQFVSSLEESMELNRRDGPQIVIAASGMCEAGRILHHLRHKIHNSKNTILIVGYMAEHTLGRRIADAGLAYEESGRKSKPPVLRFLAKEYPLKARVVKIDGLSAHADRNEMLQFLRQSRLKVKKIALVHGEEEQSLPFAETLKKKGYSVMVPKFGESVQVA